MAKKKPLTNFGLLQLVWSNTRGLRGLCRGPEFLLTIGTWVLTAPYWLLRPWWDQVIDILPTILGFTVTGFAIFLGFGSDDFKRFLTRDANPDENAYISVGAAFVLFVTAQLLAIMFALIVKGFHFPTPDLLMGYWPLIKIGNYIAGGIGYFLFLYSLSLALRASLRIFRLSRWYSNYLIATDPEKKKNSP